MEIIFCTSHQDGCYVVGRSHTTLCGAFCWCKDHLDHLSHLWNVNVDDQKTLEQAANTRFFPRTSEHEIDFIFGDCVHILINMFEQMDFIEEIAEKQTQLRHPTVFGALPETEPKTSGIVFYLDRTNTAHLIQVFSQQQILEFTQRMEGFDSVARGRILKQFEMLPVTSKSYPPVHVQGDLVRELVHGSIAFLKYRQQSADAEPAN